MRIARVATASLLALALLFAQGEAGYCARHHRSKKRRTAATKRMNRVEENRMKSADLLHPYSPAKAAAEGGHPATDWNFVPDPLPTNAGKAKAVRGNPFSLRIEQERIIDPLTQKEVLPKADPGKAEESLEKFDLKDALEKLNGKAEVRVDLFNF